MPKKEEQNLKERLHEQITSELGLGSFPKDQAEQMLVRLTEIAIKKIMLSLLDKLSPEQAQKLSQMREQKATNEEIELFLRNEIKDYDIVLNQALVDFNKDVKKLAQVAASKS